MWLPVRDLENLRPMDFCSTECTYVVRSACIFYLASVSGPQFIVVFHNISILPSVRPSQQTVTFNISSSLSADYFSSPCHQDWRWCWCHCCWQHLLWYFEVQITKISQQVLPTAVLSCNFTQFVQYNHKPLLITQFPCPVLWHPPASSSSTLTQHLPSLVQSLPRTYRTISTLDTKGSGTILWCSNVIKKGVLSCNFTQFLQYNHRPLLTLSSPN